MNTINAIQFNGKVLPNGVDWDMMGAKVELPTGEIKYILPGDWLIGENGKYTEVIDPIDFANKYDVEIIIKPKIK